MYDMYPEWGPSRPRQESHDSTEGQALTGIQAELDPRDNGGRRPDDTTDN